MFASGSHKALSSILSMSPISTMRAETPIALSSRLRLLSKAESSTYKECWKQSSCNSPCSYCLPTSYFPLECSCPEGCSLWIPQWDSFKAVQRLPQVPWCWACLTWDKAPSVLRLHGPAWLKCAFLFFWVSIEAIAWISALRVLDITIFKVILHPRSSPF